MKKHILLFWLVLFLLSTRLNAQTVYITKTGEKFHLGSCHYLSKSKIAIDLKEALSQGYEACKVCRPSQDITNTRTKTSIDEKPDPETTSTTTTQCSATTQKGARCKRTTSSTNGKCWQHGGN